MDAHEAREHIEMVDRILDRAERKRLRFRPWASLLITFGIGAAMAEAGWQWALNGGPPTLIRIGAAIIVLGYVYMIAASIYERRSGVCDTVEEQFKGRIIGAVWLCIIVSAFAQPHIFSSWANAAIFNVGSAIQMMIVGFTGDRRSTAAGVVILVSLIAANIFSAYTGYILAAGMIFGYFLPGVLYATESSSQAA